jgi:hypothetical protein
MKKKERRGRGEVGKMKMMERGSKEGSGAGVSGSSSSLALAHH